MFNATELVVAIPRRQSCRHFLPDKLSQELQARIESFLAELRLPFSHQVRIVFNRNMDTLKTLYFPEPPQFISLQAPESLLEQAKLGFIGEVVVLFCQSLGLQTCWMGHFKRESVQAILGEKEIITEPLRTFCIIPVGYGYLKPNTMERLSRRVFSKKDRTLESFLLSDSLHNLPAVITQCLELTTRAPSAMNSQKWVITVQRECSHYDITLSKIKGYQHFKWRYYNIDAGTAAAHVWLGLLSNSLAPSVSLRLDDETVVWTFAVDLR